MYMIFVYVCTFVRKYPFQYIFWCINMYIHISIYKYPHTNIFISVFAAGLLFEWSSCYVFCLCVCVCVCVYVCVCACVCVYCVHSHTHIYIPTDAVLVVL